jgi:hypothetical protein
VSASSSPPEHMGIDKRRTTRIVQAIPIVVRGMDALGQAFKESTSTVMVNCNGCKYRSKTYVPKDTRITLEIAASEKGAAPRIVPSRVVWVQRPRTFREIFHVAIEFETPGNVWGLDFSPDDWFPHPDDEHLEVPVSAELSDGADAEEHHQRSVPAMSSQPVVRAIPGHSPALVVASAVAAPAPAEPPPFASASDRGAPFAMRVHEKLSDPEVAFARQLVMTAVEAAMAKEIQRMRDRLEARLQETVQATVKSLAQSIAETVMKDLVESAAERTATIVVEARKICTENADALDEKIRQVVREVASGEQKGAAKISSRKKQRKGKKGHLETVAS